MDRRRSEISVGHQPIRQLDTGPAWSLSPGFPSQRPSWNARFASPVGPQSPDASRRAAGEEEASTACWIPARSTEERSRDWHRTDVDRGDGADRQETEISGRPPCRPKCMARAAGWEAGFAAAGSRGSRSACASQLGLAGWGWGLARGPAALRTAVCACPAAVTHTHTRTQRQRARPPDDGC
jgi:hypothetical protein